MDIFSYSQFLEQSSRNARYLAKRSEKVLTFSKQFPLWFYHDLEDLREDHYIHKPTRTCLQYLHGKWIYRSASKLRQ